MFKKITDWKECEGLVISCHEKNTSFEDVTGIWMVFKEYRGIGYPI